MFNGNAGLSLADIAAVTNGNSNNGFNDGNGWWILIILFAIFGGWGNNGNGNGGRYFGGGAADNYVLASDFATLQRMIQDGNARTESKLDGVNNGICSLGYDQLGQMNAIQSTLTQQHFAIQSALADCCCQNREAIAGVNYNMATNTCAINTNIANATRDIIDNQNANTRSIIEVLNAQAMANKDAKIAELNGRLQAIENGNYIVNQLRTPTPIPAYQVPNPYAGYYNGYGCGCNA